FREPQCRREPGTRNENRQTGETYFVLPPHRYASRRHRPDPGTDTADSRSLATGRPVVPRTEAVAGDRDAADAGTSAFAAGRTRSGHDGRRNGAHWRAA